LHIELLDAQVASIEPEMTVVPRVFTLAHASHIGAHPDTSPTDGRVFVMRALSLACIVALIDSAAPSLVKAQSSDATRSSTVDPTNPNALVPPVLLQKVDPVYPERALTEQQSGEVILQLDIDEFGKVTAARVTQGAGFGMDEAAQQAALQLTFRPATRASTPIKSRISYKMTFNLRLVERPTSETQPPDSAAPAVATIRGIVRLEQSEVPCVGAMVEMRLADGSTLQTTTDANGNWEFDRIAPGKVVVQIASPGYETLRSNELLLAGESVEIKYRLRTTDGAIEVSIQGERPDREVTRRTVERQELAVVPGTGGDALKAVQSLPGVGRTPVFGGMIVVRGSSPYGTQTFVDGTFVPAIYHFGGLSSIVPTEMIESIDFYPGNFSAKYGRVTGGIIDVKLREMDRDDKYHGLAQVDLIDARLMLRGPVPLAKGWSFNFGARRSHIDTWIGSVMSKDAGFRTAPVYYDWQAFAETKPTARSLFRIGMFGSDDRLDMVLKNGIESDPGMGNSLAGETRTMRLQAIYRNQITGALSVNATASVGLDKEFSQFGSVSSVNANYVPMIFRGDLSYRLSDQFLVRVGPDVIVYRFDADVLSVRPPEPGEMEGSHSGRPLLRYDNGGYFSAPAAFAELEWTPTKRAKVLLGGRADYFSLSEHWDFSPRLNARYDLHTGRQRTTIKAGVGLFSEPPQVIQNIVPFGTRNLKSNRSVHSSLGIEQEVTRQVEVSVEAFHKYLDNIVIAARNADGSNGFSNASSGYVYGTETMVRWKPGGRFFGWIAYTISRSVRRNAPDQPTHVYEFDQTHNLTVLGSYDLGRGWRAGAKFRYVTGNPYTPCNGGILDGASGSYDCIQGTLNSRRIPAFHQLDARIDKTWSFTTFKLTAYLDVQNVYNRANAEGVGYNYRYTKPQWQTGLPIIPSLGVRGEF
jgi:TonB family protein